MKRVLSVAEMRRVDAEATVNVDLLMDRAGLGLALGAVEWGAGYGSTVTVLAGKGNNGGDGYIAAAYLAGRGARVTVEQVGEPASGTPAFRAMERARRSGVAIRAIGSPGPCDVLIDAVVGTGFVGELDVEVAAWTDIDAAVIAADIPSGLNGDTGLASGPVFDADATITFHSLKAGHLVGDGPDLCGEITVIDIGLSGGEPEMWLFEDGDVAVPYRARTDHKWSSGAVATIGGMPGLTGAALFAARAALAAGAGVSNLVTTASTAEAYLAAVPDIPTMEMESIDSADDADVLIERLSRFDAVIIGPGLEPAPGAFVERLVNRYEGVLIVDAGALNVLDEGQLAHRGGLTILTPHAGEFERLTGVKPSHHTARNLAEETGTIVVLKGNPTFVTADRTIAVASGGPELATIGSGDALAGIIAAFVSTHLDPAVAAASAVYIHGVTGDVVDAMSMVTTPDLIAAIGPTVAAYRD